MSRNAGSALNTANTSSWSTSCWAAVGASVSRQTDATVIGAGRVDVWVRSSTPNVDLQATITEVRPNGKYTFVQNGWVRGNERKLDPVKSTLLISPC
jgi:hypothetical protein